MEKKLFRDETKLSSVGWVGRFVRPAATLTGGSWQKSRTRLSLFPLSRVTSVGCEANVNKKRFFFRSFWISTFLPLPKKAIWKLLTRLQFPFSAAHCTYVTRTTLKTKQHIYVSPFEYSLSAAVRRALKPPSTKVLLLSFKISLGMRHSSSVSRGRKKFLYRHNNLWNEAVDTAENQPSDGPTPGLGSV